MLLKNINSETNSLKHPKNRGNVTLLGLTFALMLFSLLAIVTAKNLNEYFALKGKTELLLCSKYLDRQTAAYQKNMDLTNKLILAAYIATFIPYTAVAAKNTQTLLMAAEQLSHVSYLKKLTSNRYCSSSQATFYFKNLPYETVSLLILKRSQTGEAIKKDRTWTNIVFPKSSWLARRVAPLCLEYSSKKNGNIKTRYCHQLVLQS